VTVLAARWDPDAFAWRIRVRGTEVAGNREALEELRSAVTGLRVGAFVDDRPTDLEPYGLADPRVRVQVADTTGDVRRTVLVGGPASDEDGEAFFWMVEGEPEVYRSPVVPEIAPGGRRTEGLPALLDRPVEDYRERSLLQLGIATPEAIGLVRDGPTVRLRQIDGEWRFEEPVDRGRADRQAIQDLLRKLRDLDTVRFADDVTLEDAGFGEGRTPAARLELDYGDAQPAVAFEVGDATEGGRYVRRAGSGIVVVGKAEFLDLLRSPWFRFRDRREVFRAERLFIRRVEVRRGETTQAFVRAGAGADEAWVAEKGSGGELIPDAAFDMVAHFCPFMLTPADESGPLRPGEFVAESKVGEPIDEAAYGLADPEVVVTLTLDREGVEKTVTLKIGRPGEDGPRYGRFTGAGDVDALVFTLPESFWEVFSAPLYR
jgi:hypothetical protein